ncbi:unnamed protein product [Rotaria sordida]|uniref:Uncharacterized protein n=1 Tax=Rotaria sordida TaxID=392033 RepID=A0A815MAV0_9BILA|nr:unnamed protein product [Rotaria sordida]
MEKERKARQARMKTEREEARQKLHDKYNIKKNDEFFIPVHSKTTTLNENQARERHQASSNQADDGSTIRKMNLSINDNDKMILDDYSSSAEKNYQQKDGNSKEENGDIDLIEESK